MRYQEEESHTAFAFIAGAAVGAGLALLFAPRAGSELRSSVRDYTQRAKNQWEQASERGEIALDLLFRRGKDWIQNAMGKQGTDEAEDRPNTESAISTAQPRGTTADTGQDN